MLITSEDVIEVLGKNLKRSRKRLKYIQEFVSESVDISIDLLRNIENGRNIGSVPTLLNLCNFLRVSPNTLFSELLDFKEDTLDTALLDIFKDLSKDDRNVLKNIIIHFYCNLYSILLLRRFHQLLL